MRERVRERGGGRREQLHFKHLFGLFSTKFMVSGAKWVSGPTGGDEPGFSGLMASVPLCLLWIVCFFFS